MNIVFVIRRLERAGAERQLVTLARGMHEHGHRVTIATFYGGGGLEDDVRAGGIPLVSLRAASSRSFPMVATRLVAIVRSIRPDVVHGYLDAPNLLATVVARCARPARSVWGLRAGALDERDLSLIPRLLYRVEPTVSRFADLVIVNSESGRRDAAARGFPFGRLVVVHNGIDTARFAPAPKIGAAFRAQHGIDPGATVVLRVARVHPMKDYELFLDAMSDIRRRVPTVRGVCIGDGDAPYLAQLRRRCVDLGIDEDVVWLPSGSDVLAAYNAATVSVSSSRYGEGFPNVVGEAMACEVPCVVTDVGDSAAAVGATGAVVPAGERAGLADAVVNLLADPARCRILGQQARARVVREVSVTQLIERTSSELERLVTASRR